MDDWDDEPDCTNCVDGNCMECLEGPRYETDHRQPKPGE